MDEGWSWTAVGWQWLVTVWATVGWLYRTVLLFMNVDILGFRITRSVGCNHMTPGQFSSAERDDARLAQAGVSQTLTFSTFSRA
jgi:hypothetical protein